MDELVRASHFEGLFYPSNPQALERIMSSNSSPFPRTNELASGSVLSGCLIPHGAYEYCGKIIQSTFCEMKDRLNSRNQPGNGNPTRVLILAPELNLGTEGIKLPLSKIFRSPLGDSVVDKDYCQILETSSMLYQVDETSHLQEYTIEIILPFLQWFFPSLPIVPLLVQSETPVQRLPMLLSGLHIAEQESPGSSLVICVSNCHKPAPRQVAQEMKNFYIHLLKEQTKEQLIQTLSSIGHDHRPYGFFACALGINFVRQTFGNVNLLPGLGDLSPALDSNDTRIHYQGLTLFHKKN